MIIKKIDINEIRMKINKDNILKMKKRFNFYFWNKYI